MKHLIIIFIFSTTAFSWDFPKPTLPDSWKKYSGNIKRFYKRGKRPPQAVQKHYNKPDTVIVKHEHQPKTDTLHVVHEVKKDTTPHFNFIFADEDVMFRMVDGVMTDLMITDFE
ncbi:MAG: hypothetical protein ACTSW1_07465 [Candidatus Hodarchaeales archaeon]